MSLGRIAEFILRVPVWRRIRLARNTHDFFKAHYGQRVRAIKPTLADNALVTDKLARFARATGRHFLFFREGPADHWYPGAGIGLAFP